jgi:hypothetical protein
MFLLLFSPILGSLIQPGSQLPTQITIDGDIKTGEWEGRSWKISEFTVFNHPDYQSHQYVYISRNETHLLLGIDLTGDITAGEEDEWIGVAIDTYNDDLIADDYLHDVPVKNQLFNFTNERFFWSVYNDDFLGNHVPLIPGVPYPHIEEERVYSTIPRHAIQIEWSFGSSPNANWNHRQFEIALAFNELHVYNWSIWEDYWVDDINLIDEAIDIGELEIGRDRWNVTTGDIIGIMIEGYGTVAFPPESFMHYCLPAQGAMAFYETFDDIWGDMAWEWEINYINWQVCNLTARTNSSQSNPFYDAPFPI